MAEPGENPLVGSLAAGATRVAYAKPTRVKNKTAAPTQITAEQIVREAKERQEDEYVAPARKITDPEELAEYRLGKRKEFEDTLRRVRWNHAVWTRYATWEEQQGDFPRARSVWERALDVSHRHVPFWVKYAEMEMKARNVNHARNVWDRAVTILPRIDQLWYKYAHMEEMLGNVAGARTVFDRWMRWEPDAEAWHAYINLELRYNETDRARDVFERFVQCHPTPTAWMKYAKFEHKQGDRGRARSVYERAVEMLEGEEGAEALYIGFAQFEEMCHETERARAIYKFALDRIPKAQVSELYQRFVQFEKQHGGREGIEDVVVSNRRFEYEEVVRADPMNYDSWFDYARLEESAGELEKVREVYERAVANVPPAQEKRYWQRYIYLWINYALFEELEAEDAERTRAVYRECLNLIPHKSFTFGKVWILAAQFEIRQKCLDAARKLFGRSIGMCPKDKVFRTYIEIELQLGHVDRCRTLYEKYIEWAPHVCAAWSKFAELERSLGEVERARAIFELAVDQPVLDRPELLWKAYIDFEIAEGERTRARALYERLLERTKHVKVWLSYAQFEAAELPPPEDADEEDLAAHAARAAADPAEAPAARAGTARALYKRAFETLRETAPDEKEESVMVLEAWRKFEQAAGGEAELAAVTAKLPQRVKRKRQLYDEGGAAAGQEEFYDYIFPDERAAQPSLKILEAAYRWKRQKTGGEAADGA